MMNEFLKLKIKQALLEAINENDDIKEWITVKGNHIPIRKNETKEEAVQSFLNKKNTKIENIPVDGNGNSLKLLRIQRPSLNMLDALKKGYYPTGAVVQTLKKNTKEGKRLEQLLNENWKTKKNYKLKFLYKDKKQNDHMFDEHTGEPYESNRPVFFDTKEELENYKQKNKDVMDFISEEEVPEWHHYYGGGKSYLTDVKALMDLGFKIDISTANKDFKI